MSATPGRCGWHDLERVWNDDEQRWMCPHYSQAAEVADAVRGIGPRYERESADIEASLDREDRFYRNHSRREAQG